jgi:histidinol-phosphate phosphatase family protein
MEIVLVMGYPASGKTTLTESRFKSHHRLNRDTHPDKTLDDLVPMAEKALDAGMSVVLDNTYISRESRRGLLELGRRRDVPVRCVWLDTSIEDAQVNAVMRMVRRYGAFLSPDEIKKASKKDPNTFGPSVLFRYRKGFEEPTTAEGFASVERVSFKRSPASPEYTQKALLLDYDGTLRRTKSGDKYPKSPEDIEILPGRRERLLKYKNEGWRLLGVSNQGDVARGRLTVDAARACFERTNELLGLDIEYAFCPHDPAPINCFCRKPMPGLGVAFIEKYKLDRAQTIMVGDMTTDRTFAERVGVRYVDQEEFFR